MQTVEPRIAAEPALLDMRGAGALLGLSYWRMYSLVRNRELSVVEIGGKFYFRRATLLKWCERAEHKVRS
jgi:excisionase family DNA binding protein